MDTHFIELSRVAQLLKKSGIYNPVLWFKHPYNAIDRDLAICQSKGWEYISPLRISITSQIENREKKNFFKTIIYSFQSIGRYILRSIKFFRVPLCTIYQVRQYFLQARQMKRLLLKIRPDLLIMAEDSIQYGLHILIKLGNAAGIPTVIIPFTIANASEPAEAYFDNPRYNCSDNLINRLVGSLFPHWVYCYKGRKLLRMAVWDIIALELLGFAPKQPWVYNSEETSVIAVENESMFQYYRKEGLPVNRLIISGALYDDVLAEGVMNAEKNLSVLYEELDLTPNQPLLVCALPPSQFPRQCEFTDYFELVQFWMQTLATIEGWNILIRPHPRMSKEDLNFLQQFNVIITDIDTASLVPLCDVYVSSVSATIRWAIACGKPVVNYDVYQMNYSDYIEVGGVITINNKDAFKGALWNLTRNKEFYNNIVTRQNECMSKWGILDGKSGERMLRLFNNVKQNFKVTLK